MSTADEWASASEIAGAVAGGRSALSVVNAALDRIKNVDRKLNCFTTIITDRARDRAREIDRARGEGRPLGPLAGVPFAVKNLYDIAGLPTVAGSQINRKHKPAARDATLIERLEAAGAVLVGALNMGEYAYDFTGENVHDGPSRNPHDLKRMTGHVGPLARSARDLALAYDAMRGHDPDDPVCANKPAEPTMPQLERRADKLRIAVANGYFRKGMYFEAKTAVERVASALGVRREIEIPEAGRARSAAYIITATEGAALHLDRLRTQAKDFDPATRDRLIAGTMVPSALVVHAQKFRRWYRTRVLELFEKVDAIIAPATPCAAPAIGQETFKFDGVEMPLRPNIGIYTQPISFIGLPVVAVPVPLTPLPIGVQIIAAPWREDIALRIAHALEKAGAVSAQRPKN